MIHNSLYQVWMWLLLVQRQINFKNMNYLSCPMYNGGMKTKSPQQMLLVRKGKKGRHKAIIHREFWTPRGHTLETSALGDRASLISSDSVFWKGLFLFFIFSDHTWKGCEEYCLPPGWSLQHLLLLMEGQGPKVVVQPKPSKAFSTLGSWFFEGNTIPSKIQ